MTQEPSSSGDSPQTTPRRTPSKKTAALLGIGLALLVSAGVMWFTRGPRLPPVTREKWQEARQKWEDKRPTSFRITVEVTGPRAATYDVTVRRGRVVEATRDGHRLPKGETWTPRGMFGTIERDLETLEMLDDPAFADRALPQIKISGQFDPQWGFPRRYRRLQWGYRQEYGKRAANQTIDMTWRVTRFEKLDRES